MTVQISQREQAEAAALLSKLYQSLAADLQHIKGLKKFS